jgi:hypothetical protein
MLAKCEYIIMSGLKCLVGVIVILIAAAFLLNFLVPPSEADFHDSFSEDIGGDGFLVANLNHSLKIGEKDIPDGNFVASMGTYDYYDAKNISYVDSIGCDNYIIVWKASPDRYNFNVTDMVNQYISDYSTDSNEKCFIEYSYENDAVYGIIIGSQSNITFKESELMYEILGLNEEGFALAYTQSTPSYSVSSYPSSHYHTVINDPYSLSRNDPAYYYDHYEYGDDYDIDDYLESEGYD